MHPAIKIVNLVIISVFLTQGGWSALILTGALLLPFYFSKLEFFTSALHMLSRLKWLIVSIFLVYYFYIPDLDNTGLSTFYQFLPGLYRVAVLVFIIFTVNLFLKTTTKEEILAALLWLFLPLKQVKIDIERLSLRAVLTLEYIEVLSKKMTDYKVRFSNDMSSSGTPELLSLEQKQNMSKGNYFLALFNRIKNKILHLITHSGIIFREIIQEADKTSGLNYTIECIEPPKMIQYCYPLILLLLFNFTL
ncbi:MAG: hypothetical protein GY694_19860 [Gammaproteobacteria bacterium]|nr:hypothetical protein [Gammaproteobacteria bacterium]